MTYGLGFSWYACRACAQELVLRADCGYRGDLAQFVGEALPNSSDAIHRTRSSAASRLGDFAETPNEPST